MAAIPDIGTMNVDGRTLVVRADLNVPMRDGRVADETRIGRFAAGLTPLLCKGASAVVLSHLGRPPGGRVTPGLSLEPVAEVLARRLGRQVVFAGAPDGAPAREMAAALGPGEVVLCENLRFSPGEEANAGQFAAALAKLGDIYVNDAFSCAHRKHASTDALARLLPNAAGPLMIEEIAALESALEKPEKPAVAVVGGAKISGKIEVLRHLATRLDTLIVGGGMANTFLFADGIRVGRSLCEADLVGTVAEIDAAAAASGCAVARPCDAVCAEGLDGEAFDSALDSIPEHGMILDIGEGSVSRFANILEGAKTLLWNGPLGAFEHAPFGAGTMALACHAAALTRAGRLTSIAGGGDTVAALNLAGVADDFSYVSTAGGAFLEWLEGKTLPGVAALTRRP